MPAPIEKPLNVRMRRVCVELVRLRKEANLSGTQAAAKLGVAASTISRMENLTRGLKRDDIVALTGIYGAPRKLRVALLDLYDQAEQPNLLTQGDLHLHDDLADWIGLEATASGIRSYEPLLIPGLLQTIPYAKAVIEVFGISLTEQEVSDRVAARVARQRLLRTTNGPDYEVVLHEAALHQSVGGAAVMRAQLDYLLEAGARPGVTIRVVPMAAGAHSGLAGPFVILDYNGLPSLVHLENKASSLYLEGEEDVHAYRLSWHGLLAIAYSSERSAALIREIAGNLG